MQILYCIKIFPFYNCYYLHVTALFLRRASLHDYLGGIFAVNFLKGPLGGRVIIHIHVPTGNGLFRRHRENRFRPARIAAGGDQPTKGEGHHGFVAFWTSRGGGGMSAMCCACA